MWYSVLYRFSTIPHSTRTILSILGIVATGYRFPWYMVLPITSIIDEASLLHHLTYPRNMVWRWHARPEMSYNTALIIKRFLNEYTWCGYHETNYTEYVIVVALQRLNTRVQLLALSTALMHMYGSCTINCKLLLTAQYRLQYKHRNTIYRNLLIRAQAHFPLRVPMFTMKHTKILYHLPSTSETARSN